MNITVNNVEITLTPEQLIHIDSEVKKMQAPKKPTAAERFLQLCEGLELKIDPVKYPGFLFFLKGNECWFEYNTKNGYLWCSWSKVWNVLGIENNLKYDEIQAIIKKLVESHFNFKGVTPQRPGRKPCVVESHFNCKGVTPHPHVLNPCFW